MKGKKYFVVSIIEKTGISLTELKSRKKAMDKLGNFWLGIDDNNKSVVGYDFAVFVSYAKIENLIKCDKLTKCLKELAMCIKECENGK